MPYKRTKCGKNPTATPYTCLRSGIAIGKNAEQKITTTLTKDVLRRIAQLNKIKGYSSMTKNALYDSLVAKGITKYKPSSL